MITIMTMVILLIIKGIMVRMDRGTSLSNKFFSEIREQTNEETVRTPLI